MSPFVICLPLSPSLDAWHGSLGGRVHLSPFVSLHLSPSLDASVSFVSLCLPSFVSRCLPAWMPGWTDSLVSLCLPSFVARCLPAWIWQGFLGGRVHVSPLDFDFAWARGGSSSLSIVATPCLFVQCLVISCGPELTLAVRCGARLQLREGSVNPPVKQT